MSEVVSFIRYKPPERFDALPWTEIRIEEATDEDGTYALIDTIAISPVDSDPTDPAYQSFTTELGTDDDLWYRVIFADADGDTSQPTTPIQNTSSTASSVVAYATANELARILKVNATKYADQLAEVLEAAAGEIDSELGLLESDAVPLAGWQLSLAAQVNLERAAEHWQQRAVSFGIIGLDSEGPIRLARDTWDRHAHKLAPLKDSWGLA